MVLRNIIRSLLVAASAFGLPSAAGVAQTMTRLSEDRTWHPGNATSCASYSTTMPMSGDGRYIAFDSLASNLVAGDTNGWSDVFVQERSTGKLVRMSVSSSGASLCPWPLSHRSPRSKQPSKTSAKGASSSSSTIPTARTSLHDRDPRRQRRLDGGNGASPGSASTPPGTRRPASAVRPPSPRTGRR